MNCLMMKILTMMKIHVYKFSFILLILLCTVVQAQEKTRQNADTTSAILNPGSVTEPNNKLDPFSSYEKKLFIPPSSAFSFDKSSIMLRTRLQLGEMIIEDPIKTNFRLSILNPLHEKYVESQSMKELKYILGAVQAGAVGYLAYQHLKKYGFLKKK